MPARRRVSSCRQVVDFHFRISAFPQIRLVLADRLPDELLDLGARDSAPPWFGETAIGLSVELDKIELFGELPLICVRVVYPAVGVVLHDDGWRLRFLEKLPYQRCQHLDTVGYRGAGILVNLGEDSDR